MRLFICICVAWLGGFTASLGLKAYLDHIRAAPVCSAKEQHRD